MTTAPVSLRREIADAEQRYAQLEADRRRLFLAYGDALNERDRANTPADIRDAFDASQQRLSEYLSAQTECDRARDRLAEVNREALTGG